MLTIISSFCDYVTEGRRAVKQLFDRPVPADIFSSHPVQPKDVIQVFGPLAFSACRWLACVTSV